MSSLNDVLQREIERNNNEKELSNILIEKFKEDYAKEISSQINVNKYNNNPILLRRKESKLKRFLNKLKYIIGL